MHFLIIFFALLLSGCGTLQKWAMRSASPMFQESSELLTEERSWDYFKESAPANLKFLELLYLQDEDNLRLLGVLIKGHAGYAYAVPETLAFEDDLQGVENSHWKKRAIIHYTRALDYGLMFLKKKGIGAQDLLELEESKLSEKLDKEINKKEASAILYTAQAWGSLINLQKDNIALVAQVPKVKGLFDWVCGIDPEIDHGVCEIFYAQYEASRPKMLGGDPVKANDLYLAAMIKRPRHLLLKLNYIQYLILPAYDEEKYGPMAKDLKLEFAKWEDMNRDELKDKSEYQDEKRLNLYNAIAKKRFEIIEKNKSKIF